MGHDLHFLERLKVRVDEQEQALALALYFDPELTRTMLELATLPEGVERVALALRDVAETPHIIVKRSGAFVTCLAAGMSTGEWPVLSRIQVNGLRVRAQRMLEARKLIRPETLESTGQVLDRFGLQRAWTPREDLEVLLALSPLLHFDLLRRTVEPLQVVLDVMLTFQKAHLGKTVPKKGPLLSLERRTAGLAWAFMHYAMLSAEQPRLILDDAELTSSIDTTRWGMMTGSMALFIRGAWSAARLGTRYFPQLERRWRAVSDNNGLACCLYELVAMASRHPSLAAEIRALVAKPSATIAELYSGTTYDWVRDTALLGIDSAARLDDETALVAQRLEAHELPHLRLRTRFDGPDSIPEELARFSFVTADGPIPPTGILVTALPRMGIIGRAPITDFFLPKAQLDHFDTRVEDTLNHGMVLAYLHRFGNRPRRFAAPRVPRNGPCPCGSGKKAKHCCIRPAH